MARARPGDGPRAASLALSADLPAAPVGERLDAFRQRLEQELARATRRLQHAGGSAALEASPESAGGDSVFDETDHIHRNQAQELGFATRERLAERIVRIQAALRRIGAGEYGRCVDCGEPVSAARLEALPEVERCVRCQERVERRRRSNGGKAA